MLQKFFFKKNWVSPDDLIYYTTGKYLHQLPYGDLFFNNFIANFLPHLWPIFLLMWIVFIYMYWSSFVRTDENLWKSFIFCMNPSPSFKMYLLSSKHDNDIFLTSYVPILFFAVNSSHFVSDYFFYQIKCLCIH